MLGRDGGKCKALCDIPIVVPHTASCRIQAIRSHVDTTHAALTGVTAMLEVKRAVKDYLDLQLVAFPQQGIYRAPGGLANLERALDLGVEVVGGIPHFERTAADGTRSVVTLCEIAAKRGLLLDLHGYHRFAPAYS